MDKKTPPIDTGGVVHGVRTCLEAAGGVGITRL